MKFGLLEMLQVYVVETQLQHFIVKMMNLSYNPIAYGCGLENYIRAKLGMLAVCVELSPMTSRREQHPDNQFNKLVWSKVAQLPIIYLEELLKTREFWPVQMQDYFVE